MKRGQIYYVKSHYQEEGSEQRAGRPAVIVSNNACNENSEVVEVVYLTTRPKNDLPTHVFTRSALAPSTILCEQIHSVSVQRIDTLIGELTEQELAAVDTALAISLGLDFPAPVMREPTEEELEKLVEEMKKKKLEPVSTPPMESAAEVIKLETERDLYRQLYKELLETMTKGTKA